MTTIATDGVTMAGDGQVCMSGTIIDMDAVKVQRLSDGSLFAGCGSVPDCTRLATFLDGGSQGDWPKLGDDFGAIILRPDGSVFTCSESEGVVKSRAPIAMGSGMDFALGAMDAGLSPADAVRIAIGRDPRSGGTITVEHIQPSLKRVA